MTYDPRPGTPDGPPKKYEPSLAAKLFFSTIVGIPVALVLTAMVWAIAWLITHFPA